MIADLAAYPSLVPILLMYPAPCYQMHPLSAELIPLFRSLQQLLRTCCVNSRCCSSAFEAFLCLVPSFPTSFLFPLFLFYFFFCHSNLDHIQPNLFLSLPFGFCSATWLGCLLLSASSHSAFRKKTVALLLVTDLSDLEGKKASSWLHGHYVVPFVQRQPIPEKIKFPE